MKKRVLSIVLALSVMATAFTGCGAEEPKETGVQASVEASTETGSEASSEASTEASSEANTEESIAASTEEISEASSEANVASGDWATAYDTYFDDNEMLRDNSQLVATVIQEGLTMEMITAVSGENFRMLMDFGTASLDIYAVDGQMYSKTFMEGEEQWIFAPIQSEEDEESVKSMNSTSMENENIVSYTYRGEEEIDGVMYDVLDMVVLSDGEEQEMACYINRETQLIDKYTMTEEGETYDMFIEDIEGIELPAEAANATEATVEDIAMNMFVVIMAAAMGSMEAAQ